MHRNAHHWTTSDWACSWRITVLRWLKKSYEGHFHKFHIFLSAENKYNERNNQRAITLGVQELFELCHSSPHNKAWKRRNEVPCISSFSHYHATLIHCNSYAQSRTFLSCFHAVAYFLCKKKNLKNLSSIYYCY